MLLMMLDLIWVGHNQLTFAFDGFHAWKLSDTTLKTISVEEMAVVTKDGARYLTQPQENLILIPNKN